ncbi:unnamed protein product [Miscanthus lutarioriparius]|uniref:Plant heme peroxidase family profile domain-containing protein n=1 Tax=Miscanthus lutarioriparius TaxID=422564 RepID=A0A811SPJ6_9POAL|nr:unnamed protein product [Miscanthus lutarioriparius]
MWRERRRQPPLLLLVAGAALLSHGPWYDVETGRRDGNVTVAEYVENDLPPPDSNIVDVKTFFSVKSLNSKDIAVLFGS